MATSLAGQLLTYMYCALVGQVCVCVCGGGGGWGMAGGFQEDVKEHVADPVRMLLRGHSDQSQSLYPGTSCPI